VAGALCGTIFTAAVGAASVWWKLRPQRSAADDFIYDGCLVQNAGNTAACDALMRIVDRERASTTALKEEAAKLLAAGYSKREVVQWAIERGFVGSQLSDAVGISLKDLQDNNY